MSFSDFAPSDYFGLLAVLAMLAAMVTNLTLLPVKMRHFVAEAG